MMPRIYYIEFFGHEVKNFRATQKLNFLVKQLYWILSGLVVIPVGSHYKCNLFELYYQYIDIFFIKKRKMQCPDFIDGTHLIKQQSGHDEPGEPSCVLVSFQINESFANLTWQPIRDMFRSIVLKTCAIFHCGWNSKKNSPNNWCIQSSSREVYFFMNRNIICAAG